jgi:hypothetical protein
MSSNGQYKVILNADSISIGEADDTISTIIELVKTLQGK